MHHDPRYLAGIVLFNAQDFFEAHEVWEDLWSETCGNEHRFYQGLIQAAVGLCQYRKVPYPRDVCQGILLDWPRLQALLAEEIAEAFSLSLAVVRRFLGEGAA